MKQRLSQFVVTALLVGAVVLVALNTYLAFLAVRNLSNSEYWVAHTWEVVYSVERVISSMKDAETGSRGYLVTGSTEYLDPYSEAIQQLPAEVDRVQKLTADNPAQQRRIVEMRAVIEERLRLLASANSLRNSGETNSVHLLVNAGTGKQQMDHLRAIVSTMQDEERRLLAIRIDQSQKSARRARVTVIVAGLLDLIMILITFRYLIRERDLRIFARTAADRATRLQTINDVAITQLSLSDLTRELLERVRGVIHADSSVLCMLHGEEIEIAASNGIALPPGKRIVLDPRGPLAQAARSKKMVALTGRASSAILAEAGDTSTQALLVLPLITSGKVIGLLVAGRHHASAFEEVDEQLFSVVADRIAISLDRANAYEAEREARRVAEVNAEEVQLLNTELEDRVRQRTAELEATNKELEAFSYSVSHDLRAPLRSIDGFSHALQEDFEDALNDEARDYLRRIRQGVQRMGQLIDSLLRLSRITRAEFNREPVNISELAQDVLSELRSQNPGRSIDFEVQPDMQVEADPRLLRVALENLIGNAVKFTSNTPQTRIAFGRSETSGEFYVRDNGAGFDMQYAPKLFNAFQRLHGDKDFAGSGIGLATVARVIRRHHGSIRAEGKVGVGATFWFTLG